jgi:hypothetical protein
VPTSVISSTSSPNLTSWATFASSGRIAIAIDNLAATGSVQPLLIPAPANYSATEEALTAPSVEARARVALGGASVTRFGLWRPRQAKLSRRKGYFRVVVAPASAVIVTLRRARFHR